MFDSYSGPQSLQDILAEKKSWDMQAYTSAALKFIYMWLYSLSLTHYLLPLAPIIGIPNSRILK